MRGAGPAPERMVLMAPEHDQRFAQIARGFEIDGDAVATGVVRAAASNSFIGAARREACSAFTVSRRRRRASRSSCGRWLDIAVKYRRQSLQGVRVAISSEQRKVVDGLFRAMQAGPGGE